MMTPCKLAFPTPVLPGSGSKGRPPEKGLSAYRLPQLYFVFTIQHGQVKVNGFLAQLTRSEA